MRTLGIILLVAALAAAQDLGVKAPPQEGPIALVNARVWPSTTPGYLLFEKGRIVRVGEGAREFEAGTQVIDVKGSGVYPGLFAPYTRLGLVEIGAVRASRDTTEVGDFTPEVRAAAAVNPDSTLLPVTRSNGILTFATFPQGGLIAGRASVMTMDGWTWEDMALRADAGLCVTWPRDARPRERRRRRGDRAPDPAPRLAKLIDAFDAAEAYLRARAADPRTPEDVRFESMRSSLSGALPVFFEAQDYEQIAGALEFAKERKLRPVIVGGRDALLCLDLLQACGASVILDGIHAFPRRSDSDFDEVYRLPSRLEEAGVLWCMGGGDRTANERNLPYTAARAVAYGLSIEAAMRSITISPARIYGLDAELGTLEPGKRATLFVASALPLEVTTQITHAFIDGRAIDLRNKQTALAHKYRQKYGSPR